MVALEAARTNLVPGAALALLSSTYTLSATHTLIASILEWFLTDGQQRLVERHRAQPTKASSLDLVLPVRAPVDSLLKSSTVKRGGGWASFKRGPASSSSPGWAGGTTKRTQASIEDEGRSVVPPSLPEELDDAGPLEKDVYISPLYPLLKGSMRKRATDLQ